MKITENAKLLLKKYKQFQKIDLAVLALAAICLVFFSQPILTILLAAVILIVETKYYVCPHCKKALDPRRRIEESSVCPRCQKYIFKDVG